jgi:hypothetical protein
MARTVKRIPEEVKAYIITALACFDDNKQIIKDVKEKFGVDVYQQQLTAYDPANVAGQRLSKPLKKLFEDSRKKFLEDLTAIPIANTAVRLRTIQRMVRSAEERGNMAMVASLLEQAAKETGGAYTNRQKVDHTGVVGTMNVPAPAAPAMDSSEAYKRMLGGGR